MKTWQGQRRENCKWIRIILTELHLNLTRVCDDVRRTFSTTRLCEAAHRAESFPPSLNPFYPVPCKTQGKELWRTKSRKNVPWKSGQTCPDRITCSNSSCADRRIGHLAFLKIAEAGTSNGTQPVSITMNGLLYENCRSRSCRHIHWSKQRVLLDQRGRSRTRLGVLCFLL